MSGALIQSLSRRSLFAMVPAAGAAAALPRAGATAEPRDIHVLSTHVAGSAYYEAPALMARLVPKAPLALRRDPGNRHDRLAIEVLTPAGGKLGYVPRADIPVLARLMDGGKAIHARVSRIRPGRWDDIRIRIYLRE